MNESIKTLKTRLGTVTYENIISMEWWNRLHETARAWGLLVVFPVSDDLLCTAGCDKDEYSAWEGTTLYVSDKEVVSSANEITGNLLYTVTSVWLDKDVKAWNLITTTKNYDSFDIYEDGELWANGLIIDDYRERKQNNER